MRQHFRIRFGSELIAGSQQIRLQFLIVFNDAIVNDGQMFLTAPPAAVRVRVAFHGRAVRRPARMPDAGHSQGIGAVRQLFFQRGQTALRLDHVQPAALHKADARGIVATVFETPQAFNNERNSRAVSGIADDAAHRELLARARRDGQNSRCVWRASQSECDSRRLRPRRSGTAAINEARQNVKV